MAEGLTTERRCAGHKRDGSPCRKAPIVGATVCFSHGAAPGTPAWTAAKRRVEEQKIRNKVTALVTLYTADFDPDEVDPTYELLRMLWTASLAERVLREWVRTELGDEWLTEVSYGVQGKRTEMHPLVKEWRDAREQVAKFAKMAIDAKIAERELAFTAEMAGLMATTIRTVIYDIDIKLEPWQQERILDGLAAKLAA